MGQKEEKKKEIKTDKNWRIERNDEKARRKYVIETKNKKEGREKKKKLEKESNKREKKRNDGIEKKGIKKERKKM